MHYKSDHKSKARKNILAAAGRRLRRDGFHGVGVDGLVAEAGLTSGAFYAQFSSKNEVLLEILKAGLETLRKRVAKSGGDRAGEWLVDLAEEYLGSDHCQDVSGGCVLPSLSVDVVRAGGATQLVYESLLTELAAELERRLQPGNGLSASERAWAILATLCGGVMLARALPAGAARQEVLASCRQAVVGRQAAAATS